MSDQSRRVARIGRGDAADRPVRWAAALGAVGAVVVFVLGAIGLFREQVSVGRAALDAAMTFAVAFVLLTVIGLWRRRGTHAERDG